MPSAVVVYTLRIVYLGVLLLELYLYYTSLCLPIKKFKKEKPKINKDAYLYWQRHLTEVINATLSKYPTQTLTGI